MKKYQIIYADPPWEFSSKQPFRSNGVRFNSLEKEYDVMSIKDICDLPIKNIADKDCALFMWVTDAHLQESFKVIESWGFKYITIAFIWEKITKDGNLVANLGAWTMKNCEICLLATRGKMQKYKKNNGVYQLITAIRTEHSKKPDIFRDNIVKIFGDLHRIELFCRGDREKDIFGNNRLDGWDVWGNEVESDIELINEESKS